MNDEAYTFDPETRTLTVAQPGLPASDFKLTGDWCDIRTQGEHDNSFYSYPQDGECECGMWKHHVHGVCGHVTQVG